MFRFGNWAMPNLVWASFCVFGSCQLRSNQPTKTHITAPKESIYNRKVLSVCLSVCNVFVYSFLIGCSWYQVGVMVFHGSRLVFHGSRSVFYGFSWFQVVL